MLSQPYLTAYIVISDMYSMRSRGLAQGVASVFNGLGMGLGGPLGGIITDWFGWRAAFLIQLPLFLLAFVLTSFNLNYVTPGKGRSTKEVLKRIDYGGSITLLITVGSLLFFLSTKYNEGLAWSHASVIAPLVVAAVFAVLFVVVELRFAPEPVLAPSLLRQRIPVLMRETSGPIQLWLSIVDPPWFWQRGRTADDAYRTTRTPPWYRLRRRIWRNAHSQRFLVESQMAVGTGFGQLFRGVGQVGGVAISSAIFQYKLDAELRARIHGPGSEELIMKIRRSATLVGSLPPDIQRHARDAYDSGLKTVFIFASIATLMAYLVRLPIPEKALEHRPRPVNSSQPPRVSSPPPLTSIPETPLDSESENEDEDVVVTPGPRVHVSRRLSGYESADGVMDLESNASRRPHPR
ncbi:hypothetical protein ONZ45_g9348 [Pleurotus djamor]|nr:hypothetical protein ONZ45_g9668 [Pleurotus djamor]KAJ8508355.1 hypothetical protein ONZ45_g9348 [Pleurotus djamor]